MLGVDFRLDIADRHENKKRWLQPAVKATLLNTEQCKIKECCIVAAWVYVKRWPS